MELGLFKHIYMMNVIKVLHEVGEILCSGPNSVSQNIEDLSQTIIIFENRAYKKNITVTHEVREDLSPKTYILIWRRSTIRDLFVYTGIKIRKVPIYSMRRTTKRHGFRPTQISQDSSLDIRLLSYKQSLRKHCVMPISRLCGNIFSYVSLQCLIHLMCNWM